MAPAARVSQSHSMREGDHTVSELSAQQIKAFRQRLEEHSSQLREEIRQELLKYDDEQYLELAGKVHDSEEESVADLLVDLNLADIDRHVQEMRAVESALLRIDTGRYGVCSECNSPIAVERLQVQPAALRCLGCQALYEQRFAQPGHPSL